MMSMMVMGRLLCASAVAAPASSATTHGSRRVRRETMRGSSGGRAYPAVVHPPSPWPTVELSGLIAEHAGDPSVLIAPTVALRCSDDRSSPSEQEIAIGGLFSSRVTTR